MNVMGPRFNRHRPCGSVGTNPIWWDCQPQGFRWSIVAMSRRLLALTLIPSLSMVGATSAADLEESKRLAQAALENAHAHYHDLLVARADAIGKAFQCRREEFRAGRGTLTFYTASAQQLRDAELALARDPDDRLAVLEEYWM